MFDVNKYGNEVFDGCKERIHECALDDDAEGVIFNTGIMRGVGEGMAMYAYGKTIEQMQETHNTQLKLAKMSANETNKYFVGYAAGIQIVIQYIKGELNYA